MNLLDKIAALFASIIPTRTISRYDVRTDPTSLAQQMTPDFLAEILRSAETGDTIQLFALYRDIIASDSHLQHCFVTRKGSLIGDTMSLQPFDKKNVDDVNAVKFIESQIKNRKDFDDAIVHLMDSILYPVSIIEKVYRPSLTPGVAYELAALVPVPYQLLKFYNGKLQIADTDQEFGQQLGTLHDPDPNRYIIHRSHLLTQVDNWGGPMRCLVFWWLLGTMDREWWARFLDRYGSPFLVGKYDQADDTSRTTLERAFSLAVKIGGLVVSRQTEVEMQQAAASDSGEAYEKFKKHANDEMTKIILGETEGGAGRSTSLNGGAAGMQERKRLDTSRADARRLGVTLSTALFAQILKINNQSGRAPLATWGSISPQELAALGEFVGQMSTAGLEPTDDGVDTIGERSGIPFQRSAPPAPDAGPGLPGQPGDPRKPFSRGKPPLPGVTAFGAPPFSPRDQEMIARGAAATLPRHIRAALAPVMGLIKESKSPEEAMAKVQAFCAKLPVGQSAEILEAAMQTFAADGASVWAK